jgi:choline-phosphate cytidylyltransferase
MEQKRVLIAGVFDLFSLCHMRLLEKLKTDPTNYIIVGVYDDETIQENKILTVMTGYERSENLKHTRLVDEIIYPCPFVLTQEFIQRYNIDVVMSEKFDDRHREIHDKFQTINHSDGTSTNDIIARVLNEYDEYCERSLSRGYAYNELGLKELDAKCLFLRLGHKKVR